MLQRPNILVCSDFSSFSDNALRTAEKVRSKSGGSLHVIHVSEHSIMWDWMEQENLNALGQFKTDMLKILKKKLVEQMDRCNVEGEGHLRIGIPSSVIISEVLEKKIDLIFIGHKGQGNNHFNFGGLAEKIVSSSPIPVYVSKTDQSITKVAALLDPNSEQETIVRWSESMAYVSHAKLQLVSLFPDIATRYVGIGKIGFSTELLSLTKEEKINILTNLRKNLNSLAKDPSNTEITVDISTEKKLAYHLNSILKESHTNLAVMRRHQGDFLEKVLIGSETRRMLSIFAQDLLILPGEIKNK
jgi:nucleotide-binding universal stress UspA family protein